MTQELRRSAEQAFAMETLVPLWSDPVVGETAGNQVAHFCAMHLGRKLAEHCPALGAATDVDDPLRIARAIAFAREREMSKFICTLILSIVFGNIAHAQFSGEIILLPTGCQQSSECTLGGNFGYIDSRDVGWEADKGDITDGASIPRWAQFFAGEPFEERYLPAAILHDHYSKSVRPVRGWYQTQKMFHEVLIASGVSKSKAAVLFAGVLIGSGKWLEAEAGKPCPTIRGVSCINAENPGGITLVRQPSLFGTPEYNELFEVARTQILAAGLTDPIPILELIRELSPNNIFFENTGGTLGGAQEF